MSTSLQHLLSKIQRHIGDETFAKIKRAELIDIVDDSIFTVASRVRLWVEQVTIVPRNVTETYTVNVYADLASLSINNGDETAFVLQEGRRYRVYNNAWEIYPYNMVKVDPTITQISKTLQVWKNGVQCREQSLQSINQGYSSGFLFAGTNAVTPVSLGTEYAHYRREDDGSDFVFARDFESGDTFTVIYRKERPHAPSLWNSLATIPHAVMFAIQWQAISMCQTSLYMQGDEAAQNKSIYAKQMAEKELNNADAYLRNLLDENSSITVQPLRWLAE
jgi:hypothetical protein